VRPWTAPCRPCWDPRPPEANQVRQLDWVYFPNSLRPGSSIFIVRCPKDVPELTAVVKRFFSRSSNDDTVSADMSADTALLHGITGTADEELRPRIQAMESSGAPGERSVESIVECRAVVLHFANEILEGSIGLTMPIPQGQLDQLNMVQNILYFVADECAKQRAAVKPKSEINAEQWGEWELELLDAVFMIMGKASLRAEGDFWIRVHCLAMDRINAKSKQRASHQRFFLRKHEKHLTFQNHYKVLTLCGLANPQQLSEGDLLKVRRLAVDLVDELPLITASQKHKAKTGKRIRFKIDPAANSPAAPLKEKPDEDLRPKGNEIFLDTSRAVIDIGICLKNVREGNAITIGVLKKEKPKTLQVLLRHLMSYWGKTPVRGAERIRSGIDVNVQFSVGPIHEVVSKAQGVFSRDDLSDEGRLKEVGSIVKGCFSAEVIDESETGMRLRVKAVGVAARSGDLVCVMTRYSSSYVFVPGEIRWVETVSKEEFDIGVLKLGKQMAAVTVLPDDYVDELEETIPAFLARSVKFNDKHWRLIAQSQLLQPTHDYLVDVNGGRHTLSKLKSIADSKQIDAFRCILNVQGESKHPLDDEDYTEEYTEEYSEEYASES